LEAQYSSRIYLVELLVIYADQLLMRRSKTMNKEYYQAKADLCRDLAIKQMVEGDSKEAGANLIRMVNALNELQLINYKEEKDNVVSNNL
jgi:hypothetical protein